MNTSLFRLSPLLILLLATPLSAQPFTVTTVTFQQGIDGYSGTFDRKINPTGSVTVNGADVDTDVASYFLDGDTTPTGDANRHGLLRFDDIVGGSGIPAGAKVISATIDLVTNTVADAQSGGAYNMYRLNTAFDSNSTWQDPFGGDGILGDVDQILGSFDRPAAGEPVSARADKAVQSWVDGAPNLGFGIRSDRTTDGWSLNTTGASTIANRPKLTVEYTLDPLVEITRYQNGVDAYAGATDLRLDSNGNDIVGSTTQQQFLDGFNPANNSPDQSYLVRFDDINLDFQQIFRAELVLITGFASSAADSPGPFTVHQVLQDWSTDTTYADLDSDGDPTLNLIPELVAGGMIDEAGATVTGMNDTEVIHIDVTSIVENWRAGQPNLGFYIGTAGPEAGGTDNGWQIFLTGADDASFRPELRIIGVLVPEPAGMSMLLVVSGLLATFVSRRKPGGAHSARG